MTQAPSPGLYLHVPFCSKICPYCDFAVLMGGRERRGRFVERLIAEARLWEAEGAALATFAPFDTIYFGGGTPSILTPDELERILEAVRGSLPVAADPWIFLEANPEDVTPERLAAWRELGVRTLSLGVQSFDADTLRFLGRRHGPEEARRAVGLAMTAGFGTVSLDLIYGSPGESRASWRRSLEEAVRLGPDHISCYQLTIHEGTPFGFRLERGKLAETPEAEQAELFLLTHELLRDQGYPAYEVSNFARSPESQSRHNRKYWDHTPYLGLGPSAHSFSGRRRWWNERKLGPYEERVDLGEKPLAGSEELTAADLALEALMLGLRTTAGLDLQRFRERYGVDLIASNGPLLEQLAAEGLLSLKDGALVPTLAGLAVADSLARSFALGEEKAG